MDATHRHQRHRHGCARGHGSPHDPSILSSSVAGSQPLVTQDPRSRSDLGCSDARHWWCVGGDATPMTSLSFFSLVALVPWCRIPKAILMPEIPWSNCRQFRPSPVDSLLLCTRNCTFYNYPEHFFWLVIRTRVSQGVPWNQSSLIDNHR